MLLNTARPDTWGIVPLKRTYLVVIGVIVLGVLVLAGSVYWSSRQVFFSTGEVYYSYSGIVVDLDWETKTVTLSGNVYVHIPVSIQNGGFYDISDLAVELNVYIVSSGYGSSLEGRLVGRGSSVFGTVRAHETLSNSNMAVDLDSRYWGYLAFYRNTVRIEGVASFNYLAFPVTVSSTDEMTFDALFRLPSGWHPPPPPAE
jgi:hypothetical protein